jgi:hypothetical protein
MTKLATTVYDKKAFSVYLSKYYGSVNLYCSFD